MILKHEKKSGQHSLLRNKRNAFYDCYSSTENLVSTMFGLFPPKTLIRALEKIVAQPEVSTPKRGRPPITYDIKQQVLQMKLDNPKWGMMTLKNELAKKLNIPISKETIRKILKEYKSNGDIPPPGPWKRFQLCKHDIIFACDFLCKKVISKTYFVFFIIKLNTREIVQYGVTVNPNTQFLRGQLSAYASKYPNSYLIHDNSGELKWFPYKEYGINGVSIVPYTPNMNAHAERFVRTIKEGCLNYFHCIFNCEHLHKIVKEYIEYYNNFRYHQGKNGIPAGPPEPASKTGTIKRKSMVFGLHSHYYREAA